MHYTAVLKADGKSIIVHFPAIPQIVSGGADFDEAVSNAQDALEVALLTLSMDNAEPPKDMPAESAEGAVRSIYVSASAVAKIEFMYAFRQSGLTPAALAGRIGKTEAEVLRMLKPYHGTKLAMLETAMRALGKRFVLKVEEAA